MDLWQWLERMRQQMGMGAMAGPARATVAPPVDIKGPFRLPDFGPSDTDPLGEKERFLSPNGVSDTDPLGLSKLRQPSPRFRDTDPLGKNALEREGQKFDAWLAWQRQVQEWLRRQQGHDVGPDIGRTVGQVEERERTAERPPAPDSLPGRGRISYAGTPDVPLDEEVEGTEAAERLGLVPPPTTLPYDPDPFDQGETPIWEQGSSPLAPRQGQDAGEWMREQLQNWYGAPGSISASTRRAMQELWKQGQRFARPPEEGADLATFPDAERERPSFARPEMAPLPESEQAALRLAERDPRNRQDLPHQRELPWRDLNKAASLSRAEWERRVTDAFADLADAGSYHPVSRPEPPPLPTPYFPGAHRKDLTPQEIAYEKMAWTAPAPPAVRDRGRYVRDEPVNLLRPEAIPSQEVERRRLREIDRLEASGGEADLRRANALRDALLREARVTRSGETIGTEEYRLPGGGQETGTRSAMLPPWQAEHQASAAQWQQEADALSRQVRGFTDDTPPETIDLWKRRLVRLTQQTEQGGSLVKRVGERLVVVDRPSDVQRDYHQRRVDQLNQMTQRSEQGYLDPAVGKYADTTRQLLERENRGATLEYDQRADEWRIRPHQAYPAEVIDPASGHDDLEPDTDLDGNPLPEPARDPRPSAAALNPPRSPMEPIPPDKPPVRWRAGEQEMAVRQAIDAHNRLWARARGASGWGDRAKRLRDLADAVERIERQANALNLEIDVDANGTIRLVGSARPSRGPLPPGSAGAETGRVRAADEPVPPRGSAARLPGAIADEAMRLGQRAAAYRAAGTATDDDREFWKQSYRRLLSEASYAKEEINRLIRQFAGEAADRQTGGRPATVVNLKTAEGQKAAQSDPNYVYIGRGQGGQASLFGNPFAVGRDVATREEAVDHYRRWLDGDEQLDAIARQRGFRRPTDEEIATLRGKVLGCFDAPHACHGDVLIERLAHLEER